MHNYPTFLNLLTTFVYVSPFRLYPRSTVVL